MSDQGPGRSGTGGGVALGIVVALVLASTPIFLALLGWVLVAIGAIASFVLVSSDDPFQRGVGSGMLAALGVLALFFAACFAIIANI